MSKLHNNRHEKFALALFQGMSQKDAAIAAGYKPSRAYETASRLVRNGKIAARIIELHGKASSKAILTVKQRKERLTHIAEEDNEAKVGYQRHPNILAIAELNKMEGEYAPAKVEVAGKDGEPIAVTITEIVKVKDYGDKGA